MPSSLHNTAHSVEDSLEVVSKLAKLHGITRSADVTDFSPIRLPVWISLRPNAKCLSQSSGKGLCSIGSQISSIMEGIEVSVSENLDSINSELYTLEEIRHTNLNFLNIDEYPLHPCIHNKQELAWHVGKRLYCDEPWMIPAEMLSLDFTMNNAKGQAPRTFRTTSNGLASGRTKTEAIVSALLETIERHSVTLNNKILGNYTRLEIGKN